jgi:hypothetical protein
MESHTNLSAKSSILCCKLWTAYLILTLRSYRKLCSPGNVENTELLGRALFSGAIDKKGRIQVSAFLPKKGVRDLSVNRVSYAPSRWFEQMSQQDARRRSIRSQQNIKFYGMAIISVKELRAISLVGKKLFHVIGAVTMQNPLHANIILPPFEGKDFDFMIADELLTLAKLSNQA